MNDLYMRILSGLMIHKEDRKTFRKAFQCDKGAEKESIIKNFINLLSSVNDKQGLLKRNLDLIEIEVFSYCNRQCWFCPNSYIDRHSKNNYMDENLYLKIINELKSIDYSGIVTYSRYNEPFADKIILTRLKQARKLLPNANLYTHSNGDYLTKDYIKELEEAGLNTLKIQYYLKKEEKYNKDKILKDMQTNSLRFSDSSIINVCTDDYVELKIPNSKINIIYQALNFSSFACNRAEALEYKQDHIRKTPCYIPFTNMYIDYNGCVMPCCNLRSDIEKHKNFILGDTNKETLWEIFNNNNMLSLRKRLLDNNINFHPCTSCDFAEYYIPNKLKEV